MAGAAPRSLSAEAAVGLRPQVASYRMLLGQSYLKAGRFGSAREAFADAMTLEPGNGKAALNLALAEIATGDWAGARKTLDAHTDIIAVSDRGLAMALAGDPAGAVDVLIAATRSPEADAKTRQNLALSLALAGRWRDARSVVAVDVAPGEVDKRILQWAAFARPTSASDQVAALLGVTPVQDPGQPVALALNAPVAPAVAVAKAIDAFMPKAPVETEAAVPAGSDGRCGCRDRACTPATCRSRRRDDVGLEHPVRPAPGSRTGAARQRGEHRRREVRIGRRRQARAGRRRSRDAADARQGQLLRPARRVRECGRRQGRLGPGRRGALRASVGKRRKG